MILPSITSLAMVLRFWEYNYSLILPIVAASLLRKALRALVSYKTRSNL